MWHFQELEDVLKQQRWHPAKCFLPAGSVLMWTGIALYFLFFLFYYCECKNKNRRWKWSFITWSTTDTTEVMTNSFYWLWVTRQRFLSHLSHRVSVQEFMCKHRLHPFIQRMSNLFVRSWASWQGGKDGAALKQETGTQVLACRTPAVSSRHPDGDSTERVRGLPKIGGIQNPMQEILPRR